MSKLNIAYHYTIADRLIKILDSGYLKLCPREPEPSETQYVWLTKLPIWDNTAFYGYPTEVLDNAGRIRITVDLDCINPDSVFNSDDVSETIYNYKGLINSAKLVGVYPINWIVINEPVKLCSIISIDMYDISTRTWKPIHNLKWR